MVEDQQGCAHIAAFQRARIQGYHILAAALFAPALLLEPQLLAIALAIAAAAFIALEMLRIGQVPPILCNTDL